MFSFLATLVKPITAIAGPIVSGWQARKSAELEGDLAVTKALTQAKITHVETAQAGNIDWDAMAMKNSAQSWKDEFWTIVLSIPMIMAFVPGFVPLLWLVLQLYLLCQFGIREPYQYLLQLHLGIENSLIGNII